MDGKGKTETPHQEHTAPYAMLLRIDNTHVNDLSPTRSENGILKIGVPTVNYSTSTQSLNKLSRPTSHVPYISTVAG